MPISKINAAHQLKPYLANILKNPTNETRTDVKEFTLGSG